MRFPRRRRPPTLVLEPAAEAERIGLRVQQDVPVTVLTVSGELSRATAATFEDLVIETIYGFPERIVVDLRPVEFLDATGINSLQLAEELCRQNDLSLCLLADRREVWQRLTSAGLSLAVLVEIGGPPGAKTELWARGGARSGRDPHSRENGARTPGTKTERLSDAARDARVRRPG